MPIELESGHLLLTADERVRYERAADWVAAELGRLISLIDPLSLADFADLLMARCVVEKDGEGLRQLHELTAEELRRRQLPH